MIFILKLSVIDTRTGVHSHTKIEINISQIQPPVGKCNNWREESASSNDLLLVPYTKKSKLSLVATNIGNSYGT